MLQGQEIFVILLVALVVLGPKRLPDIARRVGVWTSEFRRAAGEFRAGLEAEVGDIRTIGQDFKAPLKDVTDAMRDVKSGMAGIAKDVNDEVKEATKPVREVKASGIPEKSDARDAEAETSEATKPVTWIGPEPATGPTSKDAADDLAEIERTGGPVTDEPDDPGDTTG